MTCVIIEKATAKDFKFFLEQPNFLKVVDTLEKFQQSVVNVQSEEGKEFIMFKRQLYQMYEVQNRSIDEHSNFSLGVERKNLKWLYKANLDFVSEMKRINHLDNLVEHSSLKGSIFKAKTLSPRRLKGLGAIGASVVGYANFGALSLMLGPNVATLGLVASAYYGMQQFYESELISQIDFITEGETIGHFRMKVQTSPFSSRWIVVAPNATKSIIALASDDIGDQYQDQNILHISEYVEESTGERLTNGTFSLPADANRDKVSLEWALAPKGDTSTLRSYNDLIMARHMAIASTKGISGLGAMTVSSTGYSNINTENEIDANLADDPVETERLLIAMQEAYGKDEVAKMKPDELYRAYRDFIVSDASQKQ